MERMPAVRPTDATMAPVQSSNTALYPIENDPETRRLIFTRARRDRDEDGKMLIPHPLSSPERQQVAGRLRHLGAGLAPAKDLLIKREIEQLYSGWNSARAGDDLEASAVLTQFVKTLRGLPYFAVARACGRWARGEVKPDEVGAKKIDWAFPPSASQVRIVAENIARPYWDEASVGSMLLEATSPPPEPSPEERARQKAAIEAKHAEFQKEQAARDFEERRRENEEEDYRKSERAKRDRQALEAEYLAVGLAPVYADSDQSLVLSLPLLVSMGWEIQEVAGKATLTRPAGQ